MPWGAEETWPGALGFSGRPVKSGGAGAAAAVRGEEVARNARGSGWEAAGTCGEGWPRGGEAMACGAGGRAESRRREPWTLEVGSPFEIV